jgi:multiple sugar transport system substrate-binding protein
MTSRRARPPARSLTRSLTLPSALVAVLLGASACAQGSGSGSSGDVDYDPGADYQGSIRAMGFGAGDEIATTRLDLATKALGGSKVKLVEGELDIQQFLTSVAAGDPPDVVYADRNQIGTFASRGAIIPLTDCIEGEEIDTSMYNESALGEVTFAGDVYGIPEFNQVQVVQGNADLLQEAGFSVEDVDGEDWEMITEAATKIHQAPGGKLKVIGYDSKLPEFLPLWAKSNGIDLLSEDGRTAQLNDPKVVEALEWAVNVYDVQGGFSTVKAYRDSADFFGEGNQFASGTLGAMPMEQWYINVLNDVSPDAPMAFTTLKTKSGEPMAFATGSAWAIPKGADNPAAACRFAKHMTTVDSWVAAGQARLDLREEEGKPFTGVLTGNRVADEEIRKMVTSGGEPWDSGVEAMYEANENTFAMPANPAGAEFESAWQDGVNRVLNGEQEPQEALDQAQQEAQEALDAAWAEWESKSS